MEPDRFDALTRVVGKRRSRRAALSAGLAGLAAAAGFADAGAKRKGKKGCPRRKKKCGKKCIPKHDCCKDADCAADARCDHGKCESCLAQGTACTTDNQCCTGICDKYDNRCHQVRVSCANGESCPNGRCCPQFGDQCVYEKATQGACEPKVSCGYLLCGDKCSDLDDGTYQLCGYEGSGACRNGKCCCPKGVAIADCPDLDKGTGNLPRCP